MSDPKIKYDIEAGITGTEDADALAKKLRELGDALEGNLKRQADEAAASLEALGSKQGAVSGFAALRRETQQLSGQLGAAAADVDRLGAELQAAQAHTRQFAAAESAARGAVLGAKEVLDEQRAALADLRERYTGASRRTDEYREANKQLQVTIRDLTREHKAKEAALREAAQQSAAAAQAERASTTAYERSVDAARKLSAELGARNRALSASRETLAGMGIRTDALATADRNLAAAVGQVRDRVTALAPALAEKAAAMRSGATAADNAGTKLKALAANSAAAASAGRQLATESGNTATKVDGMTAALSRLGPMLTGVLSVQHLVGIIAEQQQLVLSFDAIFGSAERAAQEMEFVRQTANRLGVESQVLARSYQSLAAATKGTALEGDQTRAVFEATAKAMAVLGKSSAETDRALTAVAQMASKGTVSMEELRGQLGEALPGAMQAAAKGAGLTVEELTSMVETGSVLARDLLPALTAGLNGLYSKAAPPQTIISEWARLKNTIADTANAIGDGGASKGIAKGLAWLSLGVRGVSNAADVAGTALGEFVAKVQTGNWELGTAAELNAKYEAELRQAAEAAGLIASAQGSAAQATQASVRAVDNAIAASNQQVESTLRVRASYTEMAKGAADYTDTMAKSVQARQAEASTLMSLVSIYGTEEERRRASAEAAAMQARSTRDLADAKNAEAIIAQSYLIRLQEEALKRNDATDAMRKQIQAAQQSADAKRAEADQATAVAQAKMIEVEAAKAASAAYQDNSARVYELRGAAAEAAREVERLVEAQKLGKATADDVAAAQARAASATALYRDALRDASSAAERRVNAERQAAQIAQSAISVDVERANAQREVAQAMGDTTGAAEAQQQATLAQARAADEAGAAARREAQAIRDAADARERELRVLGQLTPEKQAEIDASRKAADAKDLEGQKADILADKLRRLNGVLKEQVQRTRELSEEEQNLQRGRTRDGFSVDQWGRKLQMGGDLNTRTGIVNFLRGAGIPNDALARSIANEYADKQGNIQFFNNPGMKKYGGSTISDSLLRAAERFTFSGAAASKGRDDAGAARTSVQSVKVDISLDGASRGSVMTDSAGAAVLRDVLGRLQEAKGRSS